MRERDIAPHLRGMLSRVDGKPHVLAMIAPDTPRQLPPSTGTAKLRESAHGALAWLAGAMEGWSNPDLLTRTLARREAVQSSQIEGTRTELDELLTYEATCSADGLPADVRITQRYVEALQRGLAAVRQGGRAALDCDLVREIHAVLKQDHPTMGGVYRDVQAWIGGSTRIEDATFVPTPPSAIAARMDELERSMLRYASAEDEPFELHVIAQMAIAHAQFETIHPFHDGNGRTGRILMPLILAAEGWPPLYLSGTLMRHRSAYYEALRQVQLQGNWGPWMDMVYRAVTESAQDTLELAHDLRALAARWAEATQGFRRHAVAARLPALLIEHPVVTVSTVAALLDVSIPAATKGVNELAKLQILRPDGRKWGQAFHADAVVQRLNRAPLPRAVGNLPR